MSVNSFNFVIILYSSVADSRGDGTMPTKAVAIVRVVFLCAISDWIQYCAGSLIMYRISEKENGYDHPLIATLKEPPCVMRSPIASWKVYTSKTNRELLTDRRSSSRSKYACKTICSRFVLRRAAGLRRLTMVNRRSVVEITCDDSRSIAWPGLWCIRYSLTLFVHSLFLITGRH